MTELWLVVLIFASPTADGPETVIRVPMHGAQLAHCLALASQVEAMTAHGGKPWRIQCETPQEGVAI